VPNFVVIIGSVATVIRILAEELDTNAEIYPFEHHKTYMLPTPYDMFGAGQALADALAAKVIWPTILYKRSSLSHR